MSLVNTYRSAVGIAVKEVARRTGKDSIINEFDTIEKERKNVGNQSHDADTEDVQKKWIISIFDFWMKHGKELQPILQMSDPYFTAEAAFGKNDDKKRVCAAYKTRWVGTSAMQNGQVEKIYDNQNVTEGNMTPDHTPFAFTNMMNGVASAINSHDAQLSVRGKDSAYGKLFKDGIL